MINLYLLLSLIPIVYVILYYSHRWSRKGKLVNLIPGPPTVPLLGNVLLFQRERDDVWNLLRDLASNYPIYKLWTFMMPLIMICNPDDAEVMLRSTRNIKKSVFYNFLHPWFQTGLLTSTGAKWQSRRKILTPAFHFNVLQEFLDIFIEEGEWVITSLKSAGGEIIKDLNPLIGEHALNAICKTAMGTNLKNKGALQYKYYEAVRCMGEVFAYRLPRPWLYNDFLFSLFKKGRAQVKALKILHGFTNEIIRERKQYHEDTNSRYLRGFGNEGEESEELGDATVKIRKKKLAMLDLLIAASKSDNQIDDAAIREEVDTFMFEGHDTSAVGMCFSLLLLAENEDIQERARQEIDEVLKAHNGIISLSMLNKLEYLERCIKESLRLYPSVPVVARELDEDLQLKNYLIPEGTAVQIHVFDIHRNPNFWPDPNKFDPDRFLPERIDGQHPYSYIPFSAGPRNCIGRKFAILELKTLILQILRNFYLKPVDRLSDVRLLTDLVIRVADPIRVKFIPRGKVNGNLKI